METNKIQKPCIRSTVEIVQIWNDASKEYSNYMAKNYETLGIHLFNMVGGQQADVIYDLGCGDGTIGLTMTLMKKPEAKIIASDLTESMCRLAAGRYDVLSDRVREGQILGYKSILYQNIDGPAVSWDNSQPRKWDNLNVELHQADNEDLSKVLPEPNAVDCIVANLSLHIVNSPEKMLNECFRVVKKGGKAIFSVWGPKEHSYYFTLPKMAQIKFGSNVTNLQAIRTNWHLSNRKELIALVEAAGFTQVVCWEHFISFLPIPREAIIDMFKNDIETYAASDTPIYQEALDFLIAELDRVTLQEKRPLGLNVLVVMGVKA